MRLALVRLPGGSLFIRDANAATCGCCRVVAEGTREAVDRLEM